MDSDQEGQQPNRYWYLVLRRLIEGVKSRKLPAVLTFIDFKKAFDSVHRGKMLKILEAYGIPVKIVQLIRLMYEKTMAKVLSPDGESELFEIILLSVTYYQHWFEEFVKSKHNCVHFSQMKVHLRIYLIVWTVGSSQILLDCAWPFELRFC